MSSIHIRKDYRSNKIKIEFEILESNIAKFCEGKKTSQELLACVDVFKKELWKMI